MWILNAVSLMPRVYLASSWRNPHYTAVRDALSAGGFGVYDFRAAETAFSWDDVPDGPAARRDPRVQAAFKTDVEAIRKCDICLVVLPAGRSAHWELGCAEALGKMGALYLDSEAEYAHEIVYTSADVFVGITALLGALYSRWVSQNNRGV